MDCKEFSNLLDAYMDGALPDADAQRMRDHAVECEACKAMLSLRQDCRRLDGEIQVPDSFSSAWRQTIREEENMEEKSKKTVHWKTWASVAAALIFVVGGTLASRDDLPSRKVTSTANSSVSYEEKTTGSPAAYRSMAAGGVSNFTYDAGAMEYPMEAAAYEMDDAAEYEYAGEPSAAAAKEKIIRSASFTVKTADYEADLQKIQDLTAEMGGRVEYMSSSGDATLGQIRSASLTLRIPSQRLDAFLTGAQGIGTITGMTQEMEDVSDSYYDTQTRLETQREKLKRLQAMIAQAEDVSDLIEIESAIADTQYYIDRYTGTLKSYDSRVDYSTVRVTVRETKVTETKEVSLGERILTGIGDSFQEFGWFLEDMVIFLAFALPWIITLAAVGLVAVLIIRARKNRKNKKEKKVQEQ
ncbi:MAG: DUF4349 domain-containing protein [Clostridia bacterium]|nr:DUF4349 domain-containing protein [Clostridia bacterium]